MPGNYLNLFSINLEEDMYEDHQVAHYNFNPKEKCTSRSIVSINGNTTDHLFAFTANQLNKPNQIHVTQFLEDDGKINLLGSITHNDYIHKVFSHPTDAAILYASSTKYNSNQKEHKGLVCNLTDYTISHEFDNQSQINGMIAQESSIMITDNDSLKSYDLEKNTWTTHLNFANGGVKRSEVDPQRSHFVAIIQNNSIALVDTRENQIKHEIKNAHNLGITDLDFNPNRQYCIMSGGEDCLIKFWDIRKPDFTLKTIEDVDSVESVKYNRFHDLLILSSNSAGSVNLHKVTSVSSAPVLFNTYLENKGSNREKEKEEDNLIKCYDEQEDSVYSLVWSAASAWYFVSVSYRGSMIVSMVPQAEKFKILLFIFYLQSDVYEPTFIVLSTLLNNISHWFKRAAHALYPETMSFVGDDKKYTIKEYMQSQKLKSNVQPCDLVLTQTPGPMHMSARKLTHIRYDHLAIIIDEDNMLHIAPPEIRLLSSNILLMEKRHPLIIRLNISQEEKYKIIQSLLKEIGNSYDYSRFTLLSLKIGAEKMLGIRRKNDISVLKDLKGNICTDLIAHSIMENSPKMKLLIENHFSKLDISIYGSFSPDDFWMLSKLSSKELVTIFEAPPINIAFEKNPINRTRLWFDKAVNNLGMIKNVRQLIVKNKDNGIIPKAFAIFKYLFIFDLIPFQKELIVKLIPLNPRIVEFVLILLQIRQQYVQTFSSGPSQLIKRMFPTFFFLISRLMTKHEIEILFEKMTGVFNFGIKDKLKGIFTKKAKL